MPADRARAHIRVLSAFGVGSRRVAELSGLNDEHVRDIATGMTRSVRPLTEQRILRIPVDASSLAAGTAIDAEITRRLVKALHARGWSPTAIAGELGIHATNISRMRDARTVTIATHERMVALFERIWDQPPTCSARHQAVWRDRAAAEGWPPPLAWDDIYTDPAPAEVDLEDGIDAIAVELAVEGRRVPLNRAERDEALRQLHAAGHGDRLIAHMLCVSDKTITRDRERLHLPANENPTPFDHEHGLVA